MRGQIFVSHFLTQTSFHCCQQQNPNIAAEEKKTASRFVSCKHHPQLPEECKFQKVSKLVMMSRLN